MMYMKWIIVQPLCKAFGDPEKQYYFHPGHQWLKLHPDQFKIIGHVWGGDIDHILAAAGAPESVVRPQFRGQRFRFGL